ncbi:hypothetical protein [Argonema antarcticum]|uniref:hypothetical protein n=1 Tax=Argonema antarcticum TaxID=2942763 RepID=UPI0020114513|nr:hypothetical protein [Argonema antarcticum]MCL1474416.1 hypothetical protein [Argonema antarcticum A004/B2]
MNSHDLFKPEQIASAIKNTEGEYRILAVDGKAVYAEHFAPPVRNSESSNSNALLVSAIAIFGLGAIAGAWVQNNQNADTIRRLTAENLILESKISKIRDLVK